MFCRAMGQFRSWVETCLVFTVYAFTFFPLNSCYLFMSIIGKEPKDRQTNAEWWWWCTCLIPVLWRQSRSKSSRPAWSAAWHFYKDSQSYLENAIREAVSFNCASKTINPSNHQTYNYKCSDVKSQLTLLNTLVAFSLSLN